MCSGNYPHNCQAVMSCLRAMNTKAASAVDREFVMIYIAPSALLGCLSNPLGQLWACFVSFVLPLGSLWLSFWIPLDQLLVAFGSFGVPLGIFGVHLASFGPSFGPLASS